MSSRKQFVSISGSKSELKAILHGVPQGSVLGPLLFLLYINDLHEAIPFSAVNLFADDTMLFNQNTSLKSLTKKTNIDLKCLSNWLNANLISLNSTKTELLLFRSKRKSTYYDAKFKIHGKRLYPSKVVKYLGVFIDEDLNWNSHIDFVCSKLKRANGALSKIRHYVSKDVLLSLYYALFHSHMSYSAQVWAQHENVRTRRILTLQKNALRLINFSDFQAPSFPLFLEFRILSFFDFIKFLNIILVHQLLNRKLPTPLCSTFDLDSLTLNARLNRYPSRAKTGILQLPRISTVRFGDHSIRYQSILSWNLLQNFLSVDDMSSLSLNRLKHLVKFYFLSSYS